MTKENQVDRRSVMRLATGAISALIGAILGIPAIAYIVGPALKREEGREWLRVGSTSKVELGTPTLFRATIERTTGWIVNEEEITIYVLTEDGRNFIAMSNVCTHLGCRVRWISDQQLFFCPCHNASFDKNGEVLSGPPPRPLDQLEVKAEDGQLLILGG